MSKLRLTVIRHIYGIDLGPPCTLIFLYYLIEIDCHVFISHRLPYYSFQLSRRVWWSSELLVRAYFRNNGFSPWRVFALTKYTRGRVSVNNVLGKKDITCHPGTRILSWIVRIQLFPRSERFSLQSSCLLIWFLDSDIQYTQMVLWWSYTCSRIHPCYMRPCSHLLASQVCFCRHIVVVWVEEVMCPGIKVVKGWGVRGPRFVFGCKMWGLL